MQRAEALVHACVLRQQFLMWQTGGRNLQDWRRSTRARFPSQTPGLQAARALVCALNLVLDRAPNGQRAYGGPHAALAAQDPIVQGFASGRLEQANEVPRRHLGHQGHARCRYFLVNQKLAYARGKQA